ncbi:MAG: ribonuclease R family protein [Cyanobacteriota bacterium]|nr:ribonuclease R family protein [Cyanobacteriota bacterium]
MDFTIAALLAQFSEDKLVAAKALEKKLGCESEEAQETLRIVLDALERLGLLTRERGKYKRVWETGIVEAKLRCSSKGFCFAIQDDEDGEDIYIREGNLSHAWNGDRVMVKMIKEGSRRRSPEGEVRVILDRANPSVLAQVKQEGDAFRAVPLDDRLLFELELQAGELDLRTVLDHLVHVSVVRYPLAQRLSLGQVTKVLGSNAEAARDVDIVACKHDLPGPWPASFPLPAPLQETLERRDCRSELTFSFGSEQTPWTEMGFTLEQTPEGWRLGLHIADVAQAIPPGSDLDREARRRGASVFLGESSSPLLPDNLTANYCFIPGADRDALSFWLGFDAQGETTDFEYEATVVRVDRQFDLSEVQAALADSPAPELGAFDGLFHSLFFQLCPQLRARRLQRGGFTLQSQAPLLFSDEGRIGAVAHAPALPLHSLLMEVVIVLQGQVARHLRELGLPALYCGQTPPDWEDLTDALKLVQNLGLEVSFDPETAATPQDFARLAQGFDKLEARPILHHLLLQSLKTPKYYSHPAPHFGLAYGDGYAHCSAPARRYGDLVNQRVLKLALTEGRDRRTKHSKIGVNLRSQECYGQITWSVLPPALQDSLSEDLHLLLPHLNDREKVAADAEKDLLGLRKAEKLRACVGQTCRGLITGVQSYGFFVELEDFLAEGLVHVSSLRNDWYEYRARHSSLVGRKSRTTFRLGDDIAVEIKNVDYYRQQIDLVIASAEEETLSLEDGETEAGELD